MQSEVYFFERKHKECAFPDLSNVYTQLMVVPRLNVSVPGETPEELVQLLCTEFAVELREHYNNRPAVKDCDYTVIPVRKEEGIFVPDPQYLNDPDFSRNRTLGNTTYPVEIFQNALAGVRTEDNAQFLSGLDRILKESVEWAKRTHEEMRQALAPKHCIHPPI